MAIKERIEKISAEVDSFHAGSKEEIEQFRLKYLAKKGMITALFDEFKTFPPEQKREFGKVLNELKNKAQRKHKQLLEAIESVGSVTRSDKDLTLPANFTELGARHPISFVKNQIIEIFNRIGYTVNEGPENRR